MDEEIKPIKNPVKAIRKFCVECVGSPYETINCTAGPGTRTPCPLYPFRQGKNPFRHSTMTKEQREEKSAQMKAMRQKQLEGNSTST